MTETIIEKIHDQVKGLKELRLTECPQAYCATVFELIEALEGNTSIEYVRLDRDFLPGLEESDLILLLDVVGKRPALKEAHIMHTILPAKAFASFITHAKLVETVELGSIDLQGSTEELHAMMVALGSHGALKSFLMLDFSLGVSGGINGIVEALSNVKTLEQVKLEAAHKRRRSIVGSEAASIKPDSTVHGDALAHLVAQTSRLSELYLNRLTLDVHDLRALSNAVATASSLHTLSLTNVGLTDEVCNELANAIAANTNLVTIDLSCNKLTDEGCTLLASALVNNNHVKLLRLWGNVKISNTGFDALVDMLEHNCVLERLPLMTPREYSTKIEAKLNQNRSHAA